MYIAVYTDTTLLIINSKYFYLRVEHILLVKNRFTTILWLQSSCSLRRPQKFDKISQNTLWHLPRVNETRRFGLILEGFLENMNFTKFCPVFLWFSILSNLNFLNYVTSFEKLYRICIYWQLHKDYKTLCAMFKQSIFLTII